MVNALQPLPAVHLLQPAISALLAALQAPLARQVGDGHGTAVEA
jgi:hypothetical protein